MVRSANDPDKKAPAKGGEKQRSDKNVGDALRRAYDEAVGEAVPDEMLDLLKKLN